MFYVKIIKWPDGVKDWVSDFGQFNAVNYTAEVFDPNGDPHYTEPFVTANSFREAGQHELADKIMNAKTITLKIDEGFEKVELIK